MIALKLVLLARTVICSTNKSDKKPVRARLRWGDCFPFV